MALGKIALGLARKPRQQQVGHCKPDHAVAKEFQTLKMVDRFSTLRLMREARMAEGCLQQGTIGETIAEGLLEPFEIAVGGFARATQCR